MDEPMTPTGKRLLAQALSHEPGAIYLAGLGVADILAIEAEAVSLHHTQSGCTWCEVIATTAREQERSRADKAEAALAAVHRDWKRYIESKRAELSAARALADEWRMTAMRLAEADTLAQDALYVIAPNNIEGMNARQVLRHALREYERLLAKWEASRG